MLLKSAVEGFDPVKLQVFLTVVNPSVVNGTQWVKFVKLFSCCIFFFLSYPMLPNLKERLLFLLMLGFCERKCFTSTIASAVRQVLSKNVNPLIWDFPNFPLRVM